MNIKEMHELLTMILNHNPELGDKPVLMAYSSTSQAVLSKKFGLLLQRDTYEYDSRFPNVCYHRDHGVIDYRPITE